LVNFLTNIHVFVINYFSFRRWNLKIEL